MNNFNFEAMMEHGFLIIPKALLQQQIEDPNIEAGEIEALLKILMKVNYSDTLYSDRQHKDYLCKRGESMFSYRDWSRIFRWSVGKTFRFIHALAILGIIEIVPHPNNPSLHIRVVEYDKWVGAPDSGKQKKKTVNEKFRLFWNEFHSITQLPKENIAKAQREWKKIKRQGTATRHRQGRRLLFPPNKHQLPAPHCQLFIQQSFPKRILIKRIPIKRRLIKQTLIMNTENRVSPQAPEIEEAIIGACLIEQRAIPLIADKLRPEMFYVLRHQLIYAAILAMYHAGMKIDILTVKEELSHRGKLEEAGGAFGITQLSSKVATSAHLEYHAQIVHEKYLRREMILGFNKLLACALDETMDIDDSLMDTHNLLDRLEGEFGHNNHMRDMDELMTATMTEAEGRIANNINGVTGIPTGLADLDRMTSGLQNGELVVIAARPGVGKTAFALHLARNAAMAGHAVAVYSLEMQGERLADRWLTAASEVSARHWRSGTVSPQELAEARTAAADLKRLPIHVDDSTSVNMEHVRSSARLLQSQHACDAIIIDYLQLCDMTTGQNNRNREQEVAQATRKAKLLAKELNVPVVLLSQLNRESENRPAGRPELAHLRESGAIEQDADVVILLYRPALARITTDRESGYPTEELGIAIIAKQRNGETGNVYFRHNSAMTKITEYVPPLEYMLKHAK